MAQKGSLPDVPVHYALQVMQYGDCNGRASITEWEAREIVRSALAERDALAARIAELEAALQDRPDFADLDAAIFGANAEAGRAAQAEARVAELEAALVASASRAERGLYRQGRRLPVDLRAQLDEQRRALRLEGDFHDVFSWGCALYDRIHELALLMNAQGAEALVDDEEDETDVCDC
ncbi:MAG TPA: hypothetical protein VFH61_12310 [Thermoleophilia bacterium]|nr:hypothetical protein [Thermoleophilia bacterium]